MSTMTSVPRELSLWQSVSCSTPTVSAMLWAFKELGTNPLSQSSAGSVQGLGLFSEWAECGRRGKFCLELVWLVRAKDGHSALFLNLLLGAQTLQVEHLHVEFPSLGGWEWWCCFSRMWCSCFSLMRGAGSSHHSQLMEWDGKSAPFVILPAGEASHALLCPHFVIPFVWKELLPSL